MDRTVIFSIFLWSLTGTVSVTTTSFTGHEAILCMAGPENIGWVEMPEVLKKSSMLMRITFHDGLPLTPIEFRLAGRDAMTSVQIKYIYFAGDGIVHKDNYASKKEGIIKMLRDIKKNQKKTGKSMEQEEAIKYYKKLTDKNEYIKAIRKIVNG